MQSYYILPKRGFRQRPQQWDEMLSLDLKRFKFLGPLLISWLNIRSRPKSEPAFSVSLQDVTDFCHDHWSSLGLAPLGKFHLHRLRHGGASHEAANRLRSLVGIQGRGRWQSLKSVRNYEKGSRLAQLFGSLDVQTQKQCIQAKKDVQKLSSERPWAHRDAWFFLFPWRFFLEVVGWAKQLPNTSISLFYSGILNSERIMICSHDPPNSSLSTGPQVVMSKGGI